MRFSVNGHPRTSDDPPTLTSLIRSMGRDPALPGLAVAMNGEVVPRSEWDEKQVGDGDEIEVLAAIGGG
jgi:sulfur carrier protein